MRLIDADGLIEIFNASEYDVVQMYGKDGYSFSLVEMLINKTPTVDAEPVRHGKWFLLDECSNTGVYCNVCSKKVFKEDAWYANVHLKSKYCPNCGAKMDGET